MMLDKVKGVYSELEFERNLKALDFYSQKARLLHLIELCDRRLNDPATGDKKKFTLMRNKHLAELESMRHAIQS